MEKIKIHHKDTEQREIPQRKEKSMPRNATKHCSLSYRRFGASFFSLCDLFVLCASVVNLFHARKMGMR
jgi:hypothetical protein